MRGMLLIFSIFGIVSDWAKKALDDGKVTIHEAVTLAVSLASVLGIDAVMEAQPEPPEVPEVIGEEKPKEPEAETTPAPVMKPEE